MANEYDAIATELFKNQAPAEPQGSEYDSVAQDLFQPDKKKFEQSQFVAKRKTPEIASEAIQYSKKLNMPVDFVERNLEQIKKHEAKNDNSYEAIIQRSPKLAKWMQDPYRASVSNDDTEVLSKAERHANKIRPYKDEPGYLTDLARAGKTGVDNLAASSIHLAAAYGYVDINEAAQAIADRNKAVKETQKNLPGYANEFNAIMEKQGGDVDKAFSQFTTGFKQLKEGKIREGLINFYAGEVKTVGELLDQIGSAIVRPKGAIRSLTESLAFSAPSLALGATFAKVGAAGGSVVAPGPGTLVGGVGGFATGSFVGSATVEIGAWINQSLEERGYDTSNPDDIIAAYSNKKLLGEIRAEAERKGITTAGIDALFATVGGKFIKGFKGTGKFAKAGAFAADASVQAAGEAASEFGGQVAARKGDLSKVSLGEAITEGIVSFGHSMGDVVIGASFRSNLSKDPIVAAEEVSETAAIAQETLGEIQAIQELGEISKESQLQTRNPEVFGEFIGQLNEQGGEQAVYFQKDDWDEFWQQKGESPVQKAEELLGSSEIYNEADQTGQLLKAPLPDYVAKIGSDESMNELMEIIRTQPDGMTMSEAQQSIKDLPATMEELANEAKAQQEFMLKVDEDVKQIRQNIENQLIQAGRDKIEAVPLIEFYRTLGIKEGISPAELAEKYGLNISKVDESQAQESERVFDQKIDGQFDIDEENGFYKYSLDGNVEASLTPASPDYLETYDETLAEYAEENGIENAVMLESISVRPELQGSGLGSKAMREIEAQAIAEGFDAITLNASPQGSFNESRDQAKLPDLVRFYESHGFVKVNDEGSNVVMAKKLAPTENADSKARAEALGFDTSTIYYHGTNSKFNEFKGDNRGYIFFTDDDETAALYGDDESSGRIEKVYINKENFKEFDVDESVGLDVSEYAKDAEFDGADGVILNNVPIENDFGEVIRTEQWVIVFDNKKIRSIDAKFENADSANIYAQDQRGRIRISGNNKFNIELLKNADKSTFFHEAGHYFLEVLKDMSSMENSSQELKDDFQTILEWFGVDSPDAITVEHHEMWARGFEAYLRDGKAPTSRLRKAFNTFKVWLTSVYKSLVQLNVDLTPEVRDVMDRMLATREEIEQAQQKTGDQPLFVDPIAAGMTEEQANKYREIVGDAQMSAEEMMQSRLIKDREKQLKVKRKELRAESETEINEMRVYNTMSILKKGTLADGSPLPEGSFPMKLSRSEFLDKYPQFKENKNFFGMFSKENDVDLELAASILGYDSVDIMVNEIANAPAKKEHINFLTDEKVNLIAKDLLNSDEISAEAEKMVHNMDRGKRLRMEYEFLATNSKGLAREITRRVTKRPAPQKDIKLLAERTVNNMAVGLIKPNAYRLAERRYAKEAGKALAAGDIQGAFEAKQKELLNYELYRKATEVKQQVDKDIKRSKKIFEKDEKLAKTRDMDLVGAARAILARYGLGRSKKDPLQYIQKIKEYNPDAYETISSIVVGVVDNPDNYEAVPYGQFRDMMDSVKSLWDLSKDAKEIEVDGKKVQIEQATAEMTASLQKFRKNKGQEKYNRTLNDHEMRSVDLLGLKAQFRRFEHWIDVMDLGDIAGAFRKYLFNYVSEATDQYTIENKKFKEKYIKLSKPISEKIEYGKRIDSDEIGFSFRDKSELLGALLHTGNESNLRKLLVGRNWGTLDEEGNLIRNKWDQFIQRMWDEGVLTKEDYDYIQAVWDLMEEIKPMAQKAHKKVFGFYFDEITANEFDTPFGKYKGGYAPAKVDPYAVSDIARRQELEEFVKGHQSYTYPASGGKGFTISRVENFNKPLALDMSLVSRHISDVLRFAIIKPAVVDAAKIVLNQNFKTEMGEIDPMVIDKMIKPALNRADKNQIYNSDPSDSPMVLNFLNSLKTSAAMQIMFANVVNTAEQIGGFGISATRIKPKYLAGSFIRFIKSPKAIANSVSEKSALMRTRTDDTIFEMEKQSKDIFSEESNFDKVKNWSKKHAYFAQAFTQNIVDNITWQGSYDESIANGLTEQQAIRKADADIRITQSSRRPIDISNFETNQWVGFFNMFYSFFNMMANVNASNFTKLYYEDLSMKKKYMKGFYLYFMGFAVVAISSKAMRKAAAGGLDEDGDDEYLDDLYDLFVGSQIDLGFAMVPVVGQALNATYKEFTGGKPYETRLSASPAISVLATAGRATAKLAKGELTDNKLKRAEIRDSLTALGLLTGLPLAPISKPINYVRAIDRGEAKPTGPVDFMRGIVTGKPGVK